MPTGNFLLVHFCKTFLKLNSIKKKIKIDQKMTEKKKLQVVLHNENDMIAHLYLES